MASAPELGMTVEELALRVGEVEVDNMLEEDEGREGRPRGALTATRRRSSG